MMTRALHGASAGSLMLNLHPTRVLFFGTVLALAPTSACAQLLLAVDNAGTLYRVDRATAALTTIGSTGVSGLGALEFAPDGTLYGVSDTNDTLYRIDPGTAHATAVVTVSTPYSFYPTGLAFASDGSAYLAAALEVSSSPSLSFFDWLLRVDLSTGQTTPVGRQLHLPGQPIPGTQSLARRSDGRLVYFSYVPDDLRTYDPATGSSTSAPYMSTYVVNGMATLASTTYAAIAGELHTVDLFTGATTRIGSFGGPSIIALAGHCAPAVAGSLTSFGVGCFGAGIPRPPTHVAGDRVVFAPPQPSIPLGSLSASGTPERGDRIYYAVAFVPPHQPAALFLGFSNTVWNGIPLPLSLASIGVRPDCTLQVAPTVTLATSTNYAGYAEVTIDIPTTVALGMRFYTQFVTPNQTGAPLPISFTNGIETVVGRQYCQ